MIFSKYQLQSYLKARIKYLSNYFGIMYHFKQQKYSNFTGNFAEIILKMIHFCFSLFHQYFYFIQGEAKKDDVNGERKRERDFLY